MRRFALTAALLTSTFASPVSLGADDPAPDTRAARAAAAAKKPAPRPAASAKADAADTLPAEAEIRAAFDAGDYRGTLQLLQRVVNLKGDAAAAYDRYELLRMKAESHLRLRQFKSAADAFALAAKATEDEVERATARATRRLVLEAKGPTIQRRRVGRGERQEKADLLDPAQRADALRIAYADLRVTAEPKLKAARRARTLPPIADAIDLAAALHDFELAGVPPADVGESAERARDELADRARELIEKELASLESDVIEIHERADTVATQRYTQTRSLRGDVLRQDAQFARDPRNFDTVAGGQDYETTTVTEYRRGLFPKDKRELNDVIATCRRIVPAVESLAEATGGSQKAADELIDRAVKIERAAKRVLNTKY